MVASMAAWETEIMNRIKGCQKDDPELWRIIEHIEGALYCKDRLCVPDVQDIKVELMTDDTIRGILSIRVALKCIRI